MIYSFNFPSMLSTATANLRQDKEAVRSNVLLLLQSEQNTLFGDPYYGTQLKRILFEQASHIIVDLVIDEIYTTLVTFIPQIFIKREDITLSSDGTDIYVQLKYTLIMDNSVDIYTINLTDTDETL